MSGGGQIKALPSSLAGAGSTLQQVSGDLGGVTGQFSGGSAAGAGCDPSAAGAFDAMQKAWQGELTRLGTVMTGVSSALTAASEDYVATDTSVMPSTGDPTKDALNQLLLGPLQAPGGSPPSAPPPGPGGP
jgi:uncharacterized protein YukE